MTNEQKVQQVFEQLPEFPRYEPGYVDDYKDGGHCGCKQTPNGVLVDYASLERVALALHEAQATQARMQHVLDRRDARIQGLLDIISAVGLLADEGEPVSSADLKADLNRLDARISEQWSLIQDQES